jgi:hypothetical protein
MLRVRGGQETMADVLSSPPARSDGLCAGLIRALPLLLWGALACADLLDIPSKPRLVEASDAAPGETAQGMDAPSGVPGEPTALMPGGAGGGTNGVGTNTNESGIGTSLNPRMDDTSGPSLPNGPGASQSDPDVADAGVPAPQGSGDPPPAGPCSTSESLGPNGNCYLAVAAPLAWADARSNCRAHGQGWDLAAIRSEATNNFLSELGMAEAWVGASDADEEGTWVWVSEGDAFWSGNGATGRAVGGAYANWNSDEPNGAGGSDCARVVWTPLAAPSPFPTWADLECFELRGSLCEGPPL